MFQKQNKDDSERALPNFERTQIAQAKDIMKPFVLRRLKRDVLKDLPKKTEEIIKCPMTKHQEKTYKELIALFSKQANEVRSLHFFYLLDENTLITMDFTILGIK